ncbi:MAG: PRC-barrel domain-containing protein [Methanobacteriaceae archaeon]|nr:PRC-barrel domain-containing protein [Methanobacteriaceae archaeon]
MKINDIIGRKIIDKNANDIGKISELLLNTETFEITSFIASIGNPLSKKYYSIKTADINALGDYIQLKIDKNDLEESKDTKINTPDECKVNELIGKTVLDKSGVTIGKISDIEFEEYNITTLQISTSSIIKKELDTITKEDISGIGDYIILKKTFKSVEE